MCFSPLFVKGSYIACGHCVECRIMRSREWAFRIALESSLYKDNCFLTLTYNDDCLPDNSSLVKAHLQSFIKNLRRHIELGDKSIGIEPNSNKIRFFACGEYGSLFGRPHYHVIIFNWSPPDKTFFKFDKRGNAIYRSLFLERVWGYFDKKKFVSYGFSSVGEVTFNTALYTAIYMQKAPSDYHVKPFLVMSRGCALGFEAVPESALVSDKIYVNGKHIRLPRTFIDKFEKLGYNVSTLKYNRAEKNKKVQESYAKDTIFELFKVDKRKKRFFTKFRELFRKKVKYDIDTGEVNANIIVEPYFNDFNGCKTPEQYYKYLADLQLENELLFESLNKSKYDLEYKIKNFEYALDNEQVFEYNVWCNV